MLRGPVVSLLIAAASACGSSRHPFGGAYELSRVANRLPSLGVSGNGDLVAVPVDRAIAIVHAGQSQGVRLDGAIEPADRVAFTPRADYLVSSHLPHANLDQDLIVWNLAGARIQAQTTISQGINSLAISDDGQLVAAGCQDGRIRWFSLPNLEPASTVGTGSGWIPALQFIPGTHRVAAIGDDGMLAIWDGTTGRQIGSRNVGRAVALAATATVIALAGDPSRLIDASTFRDVTSQTLGEATAVGFSPDGTEVVFGSAGPSARVFSTRDGSALESLSCFFNDMNLSAHPVAASYAGADRLLVAAQDGYIYSFSRRP